MYTLTHGPMPLLIFGIIIIYVMMILPKRKQDKQRQQMLENMKRGDEVETIGGIIGRWLTPSPTASSSRWTSRPIVKSGSDAARLRRSSKKT